MIEYKGIQLDESVKLYKKDGDFNKQIKEALDKIADRLKKENHTLKSEYKNNHVKILIDFKCGHEPHWVLPFSYKQEYGCLRCSGLSSEKAKEGLLNLLKNNGHELLSEYKTAMIKVLIDFKCGHEPYWITPNGYKNGHGCARCVDRSPKQAKEDLLKKIKENNHVLLSEYKNANTKVLIDFKCGHEPYWLLSNQYKKGVGCSRCAGNNPEQAEEDLIQKIKENNHVLLSEYKRTHTKVLIDFKCGHEPHWITPSDYKHGHGCAWCGGFSPKQAEELLIKQIKERNHILLSEYKKTNEKVLIDFNCGHEPHWVTPNGYKNGHGCPKCNQSKGEKIIQKWLEDNNIKYETEYRLPNKRWRYDIHIPSYHMMIEVHGKQHYEETFYSKKGRSSLKQIQETDKNKRKYAESLGYNYIEVDYREHNPELTLERFINQFNQLKPIEQQRQQKYKQLALF